MDLIEHTLTTSWQHRVAFTHHVFDPRNPVLRRLLNGQSEDGPHKIMVVLDEALAQAHPRLTDSIQDYFASHLDTLRLAAEPLPIMGGEDVKNSWTYVSRIHAAVERLHLDRHSFLIAIGGGGLLDMAGFAAATAHRGIRHVRLPSTTLSQCDSGVGVKNGINAFGKKNFIGTFCPPWAVINDFEFLASLHPRDKRAGYAEAVKIACIRDLAFFEALESQASELEAFHPKAMQWMVRRCAELHLHHIASCGDPFEFGTARPLDFGHWAAHKLEQMTEFNLRHGEAVAIGIALDVIYSRRMGYLDGTSSERILRLLEQLGFRLFAPEMLRTGPQHQLQILEGMDEFREHLGGRLSITLLRGLGCGFEIYEVSTPQIIDAIAELHARDRLRRSSQVELAQAGCAWES